MEINGQLTSNPDDIHQHIQGYYKKLLGSPVHTFGQLGPAMWGPADKITQLENDLLTKPFSESELHQDVFESEPNGAPGPDGLTFRFYQFFWDIIKSDLMQLCHHFSLGTLELQFINKSVICLIPKEPDAQNIKKFRHISLVNCSFKILSKILTFRVEPVLQRLIDYHQSSFLKNRYILDNVVLSHEIIDHCAYSNQKGIVIKIDFEKAYDKINWN